MVALLCTLCPWAQVAELFLLGLSQSLLHTIPSGAAFFIAARTSMPKAHVIRTFLERLRPRVGRGQRPRLAGAGPGPGRGWGEAFWGCHVDRVPQRCICLLPYLDQLAAYPYAENVIIDSEPSPPPPPGHSRPCTLSC